MEMSATERAIIELIREMRPFEKLEITKDQLGRPEYYILVRSQKLVIHKNQKQYLRYDLTVGE